MEIRSSKVYSTRSQVKGLFIRYIFFYICNSFREFQCQSFYPIKVLIYSSSWWRRLYCNITWRGRFIGAQNGYFGCQRNYRQLLKYLLVSLLPYITHPTNLPCWWYENETNLLWAKMAKSPTGFNARFCLSNYQLQFRLLRDLQTGSVFFQLLSLGLQNLQPETEQWQKCVCCLMHE